MEILGKEAMKTIKRALTGVLACSGLLIAGAALAVGDSPGGPRVNEINFQPPVTKIAEELYDLHTMMLILCTVIFVGVFGVMFYSIFAHRKSKGHKAANFHESTTVEIIWTIVPFVIVVLMALPATKAVVAMKDTTNADLTVKVTGYQWKWGYDYVKGPGEGISFLSTLTTPRDEVNGQKPITDTYLQEVDNPLVVPVNKKIRIITTANDVVHSWYVPAFGVKQDAIPGFVRDTWFKAEKVGTYRGFCTELCGKEHAYMPVVVEVLSDDDYAKWVKDAEGQGGRHRARSEQGLHQRRADRARRGGLQGQLRGLPPAQRQGPGRVPGARRQQDRQRPDRRARQHRAARQGRDAVVGLAVRRRHRLGHHLRTQFVGQPYGRPAATQAGRRRAQRQDARRRRHAGRGRAGGRRIGRRGIGAGCRRLGCRGPGRPRCRPPSTSIPARATLPADAKAAIDAAAQYARAHPDAKLALSGYTDKTGSASANAELAKHRAQAVRDALKAAGVAEDRIILKKPETITGGADAKEARRVEIGPAA